MPARTKARRGAPWTQGEVKLLGKVPDSVLARRFDRTIAEVVAERQRRRIRLPTPPRRWTAREIKCWAATRTPNCLVVSDALWARFGYNASP